ncbi:MAG: AAA family ATPase [Clostridiales bacterium]|jgi:AAA15 family ATPase/GTPase|nr:AAA family ATPase [Clostridiales bacterium]
MAINRVEIKDFMAFKGEFACGFCKGVNVIIGGNATGKTTLLKLMYGLINRKLSSCFYSNSLKDSVLFGRGSISLFDLDGSHFKFDQGSYNENAGAIVHPLNGKIVEIGAGASILTISGKQSIEHSESNSVYIPEKDMLSHSMGFLALKQERPSIPFDDTLTDIIAKAQLYPKKEAFNNPLCIKIREIIGGEVAYDNDAFVVLKDKDRSQVLFSREASGYKKFGLLWKLIRNGLLEKGTVLFWDEPENSLNPELIPVLVEILLELERGGVQIFLATHSEVLASYFDALRKYGDEVMFYSLYRNGESIDVDASERFDLLTPNNLTAEQAKLYEKEVEKGLGDGN